MGSSPRARGPRLLILTPDYPPAAGGIQVTAHRLATGIEGFRTLVLAPDAPVKRLAVVHPGVDLPGDSAPQAEPRPTFLTISRLQERYKGHDVMTRALALVRARLPDVRWVVIGDGSLRPALEALARSHGVRDAIDFLGTVSDAERDEWLRRARLLAMPSRLPAGGLAGEGFGIVYLEAGAFGKPVVAGRAGGALDAVVDGVTGLLVDPTDPVDVADAITRLLCDGELTARLGRAGVERARQFTWADTVRRVQDLALELLDDR